MTPSGLWDHYRKTLRALETSYREVKGMSSDTCPEEFLGLTELELADAFDAMRREIEHGINLMLAASIEAQLQADVATGAWRKIKDGRRRFRELRKQGSRVELEQILDLWSNLLDRPGLIGRFKQFFKHRHWLAHGRYWTCKCGYHSISPDEVWDLIVEMSTVVPRLAPLAARA
ncbi:MAG: hypothetical protein ACE5F1_00685 [Planctomycetota bacterium]